MEPDRLFDCLPNSTKPSSGSPGKGDASGRKPSSANHSLETTVFTAPSLIPPRVLPLLHELAQQMADAGHQHQLFDIYRWSIYFSFQNFIWFVSMVHVFVQVLLKKGYIFCWIKGSSSPQGLADRDAIKMNWYLVIRLLMALWIPRKWICLCTCANLH